MIKQHPLNRLNWVRENLFEPNELQFTPLVCPSKKKIIDFKRRAGTTKLLTGMALYECLTKEYAKVFYITPNVMSMDLARVIMMQMKPKCCDILDITRMDSFSRIRFSKKSSVKFFSGNWDFNFHGAHPTLILVDGFKYCREQEILLSEIKVSSFASQHRPEIIIANPSEPIDGFNVYLG